MPPYQPEPDRFWPKVDKAGPVPECRPDLGPCWIWLAAPDGKGYGAFSLTGRKITKAHIWSWTDANGPVPEGLELDHVCRVKLCVRPSHLEPVTHGENVSRARKARTTCRWGHDLSDAAIRKSDGARLCRTCTREWSRAFKQRQRAKA